MSPNESSSQQSVSSDSESSSVNIMKCSCVLCDVSSVHKLPETPIMIPETESKALEVVYNELIRRGVDSYDYLKERFMYKRSCDNSKAFESYIKVK